jgi:hypothetical protein
METIGIVVRGEEEGVFALPQGFKADGPHLKAENPTWDCYERLGKLLGAYHKHAVEELPWLIGDWINIGEEYFPDRCEQASCFTGWAIGTVMNYASAAKRVPPENRWLDGKVLPIRYGMDVCRLPPKEQKKVLAKAGREGLTSRETQRLVKGDPDYKRPVLPEKGANSKEKVIATFDRIFAYNEGRLRTFSFRDGYKYMWELCADMCHKVM